MTEFQIDDIIEVTSKSDKLYRRMGRVLYVFEHFCLVRYAVGADEITRPHEGYIANSSMTKVSRFGQFKVGDRVSYKCDGWKEPKTMPVVEIEYDGHLIVDATHYRMFLRPHEVVLVGPSEADLWAETLSGSDDL